MFTIAKLTSKSTGISDITNSSSFYNITNDKFLDSLILGYTASTVGAANSTNVSTAMFGTSTITAFAGLEKKQRIEKT